LLGGRKASQRVEQCAALGDVYCHRFAVTQELGHLAPIERSISLDEAANHAQPHSMLCAQAIDLGSSEDGKQPGIERLFLEGDVAAGLVVELPSGRTGPRDISSAEPLTKPMEPTPQNGVVFLEGTDESTLRLDLFALHDRNRFQSPG
jgi:hypothetical protein